MRHARSCGCSGTQESYIWQKEKEIFDAGLRSLDKNDRQLGGTQTGPRQVEEQQLQYLQQSRAEGLPQRGARFAALHLGEKPRGRITSAGSRPLVREGKEIKIRRCLQQTQDGGATATGCALRSAVPGLPADGQYVNKPEQYVNNSQRAGGSHRCSDWRCQPRRSRSCAQPASGNFQHQS